MLSSLSHHISRTCFAGSHLINFKGAEQCIRVERVVFVPYLGCCSNLKAFRFKSKISDSSIPLLTDNAAIVWSMRELQSGSVKFKARCDGWKELIIFKASPDNSDFFTALDDNAACSRSDEPCLATEESGEDAAISMGSKHFAGIMKFPSPM